MSGWAYVIYHNGIYHMPCCLAYSSYVRKVHHCYRHTEQPLEVRCNKIIIFNFSRRFAVHIVPSIFPPGAIRLFTAESAEPSSSSPGERHDSKADAADWGATRCHVISGAKWNITVPELVSVLHADYNGARQSSDVYYDGIHRK